MKNRAVLKRFAVLSALASAAAAVVFVGTAGTASASTGGVIGLCAQGNYSVELQFESAGQSFESRQVQPGGCANFTVPAGGEDGWFVQVLAMVGKPPVAIGHVGFVEAGGQNYHVYAEGGTNGAARTLEVFAV